MFDDEILRAQDSAGFVPLHTAIFHQAPQDIVERLMGEEPESMKRKKKIQKLLTQLTLAQTRKKTTVNSIFAAMKKRTFLKNNAIKEGAGEEEEEEEEEESELEREMKRIKEELFLLGYRDEAEVENVREKMEARSRSPVDILDGSSLTDVEPARCLIIWAASRCTTLFSAEQK